MEKEIKNIEKELQEWIYEEERAGRNVDINSFNDRLQTIILRHNSEPLDDFNDLSPEQMRYIIYSPFSEKCVVRVNILSEPQYKRIPLVKQALFLMQTLNEQELKLTKLGWLPLKIVNEVYHLGRPEWIIEVFNQKRINEYEANSVSMARIILELLGWIKTRKGMLSLTVKGKKAFANIDYAANEIIRYALTKVGLNSFDLHQDEKIGNWGLAYSVWLLNKFGDEWRLGIFYKKQYQKVFNFLDDSHVYETRVFQRLFYWLGIVDERRNEHIRPFHEWEFKKTDLLPVIFSFDNK